jgi:hypothetical protein
MKADRARLAASPSRDEDGSLCEGMWASWWYRNLPRQPLKPKLKVSDFHRLSYEASRSNMTTSSVTSEPDVPTAGRYLNGMTAHMRQSSCAWAFATVSMLSG